jgi:hypothetical protein
MTARRPPEHAAEGYDTDGSGEDGQGSVEEEAVVCDRTTLFLPWMILGSVVEDGQLGEKVAAKLRARTSLSGKVGAGRASGLYILVLSVVSQRVDAV